MAKYSRFDARNKKNSRHKKQSLDRDIRIRRVEEDDRPKNLNRALYQAKHEVFYDEELD
jgi:hypothetical protein